MAIFEDKEKEEKLELLMKEFIAEQNINISIEALKKILSGEVPIVAGKYNIKK